MKKNEFLTQLRYELSFFMEDIEIEKNISYYEKFIDNEIKNGKTEEQVLNELGSPILIAKTIKQVGNTSNLNYEFSNSDKSNKEDSYDKDYDNINESYESSIFFKHFGTLGCFGILFLLVVISIIIRFLGSILYFGIFGFGISGAIIFLLLIYFIYKSRY